MGIVHGVTPMTAGTRYVHSPESQQRGCLDCANNNNLVNCFLSNNRGSRAYCLQVHVKTSGKIGICYNDGVGLALPPHAMATYVVGATNNVMGQSIRTEGKHGSYSAQAMGHGH